MSLKNIQPYMCTYTYINHLTSGRGTGPEETRSSGYREDERFQPRHQEPPVGDGARQRQASPASSQEGERPASPCPAATALHRRGHEVVPDRRHRVAEGQ